MGSCLGTILSFLKEPVTRNGLYVIQYKDKVRQLEKENKRLCEKKQRIQRRVDTAKDNGRVVLNQFSCWLKDAADMEEVIANFLPQQENGESCTQENGESFECFPGCMCPNLMWRHKRGKEAENRKLEVIELINRAGELLTSPVVEDEPFQWDALFRSPDHYTMLRSRALVFDNIVEALKDPGIGLIGVHGPGGAGKTTMVKEIAKEAKNLGIFYKIVIAVVSKDPITIELQGDLASQLGLKYEQSSVVGRADELRKALSNGDKKLVVLDDLWKELELNEIGIPIWGPNHNDCKILLTSRVKNVFNVMNVRSYFSIGYLEENEAWELFTKVTGDLSVNQSIAKKVCKKCGCLPIAVVAVGAALKYEKESEWRYASYRLRISPLKYIEGIDPMGCKPLILSYEFLRDEYAKACFLLCCLFPEDAEIDIDDLVRYSFALGFLEGVHTLEAARDIVPAMVEKLKGSYLLLNGARENFVKMHVVIRDLAISITKEKQTEGGNDWPRKQQFMVDHDIRKCPTNDAWKHHTAISLRINDNFSFPCGILDCPLVHTLVLERGKSSHIIPNDFFQRMQGVRVLDLKSISQLPSSVEKLDQLQMLRLSHCKLLGELTAIQNLKYHIEILSFEESMIEELPQVIGEFTRLRSLNLRCRWLKVIPEGVISNLIDLEELYVTVGFQGWDTTGDGEGMSNASIVELKSLTQLKVLHIGIRTESFRILVQEGLDLFEKLINFVIFINFPKDFTFCDRTVNFLSISDIRHIDDEFYLLVDENEFYLLVDEVNELRLRKNLDLNGAIRDRKYPIIQGGQLLDFYWGSHNYSLHHV